MLPIIAVAQDALYVRDYGNTTDGGFGSSWANAINGNANVYYDIGLNNTSPNFDHQSVLLQIPNENFLYQTGSNSFELNSSNKTTFLLLSAGKDSSNKPLYYLVCTYNGVSYKLYVKKTWDGYDFSPGSYDATDVSYKWYIEPRNDNSWYIYSKYNGTTVYIKRKGILSSTTVDAGTSDNYGWTIYFQGLQYAMKEAFEAEPKKNLFVGAGTYPSLFPKNGVNVYGGVTGDVSSVSDFLQTREGIALVANKTNIGTIVTYDNYFISQTILDGINVTGIVNINDDGRKNITLRNSILNNGATINGGLLYNSLVYGNVSLGTNGYAVNVTATGTVPVNMNNIPNYSGGYTIANTATLPINYQLKETSLYVDYGSVTLNDNLSAFNSINFSSDRDLLGNPRLLNGKVDYGCFETWYVPENATWTTSTTNGYYPREGSNVYIMDNSTLVLGTDFNLGNNLANGAGRLIMQEGASLYGQGHNVKVSRLCMDKHIPEGGRIISLPVAHAYTGSVGTAYMYNASKETGRAKPGYEFCSGCWEATTASIPANVGVLYVPTEATAIRFTTEGADIYTETAGESSKTVTLNQSDDYTSTDNAADFTSVENMGWNCIGIQYLVSDYKPYNTTTTAAHGVDGKYMMNLPHTLWLYYDGVTYPDGTTPVDGGGGFYSVPSWDGTKWNLAQGETACLRTGEGFFTQTATVSTTEALTFYRPMYVAPGSSAKAMANTRYYVAPKKEDLDLDAEQSVAFNINRNMLTISNLKGDERIDIYTMEGMQKVKAEGNNGSYSCTLRPGMYVVKVNDLVRKVMVR